MPEEYVTPTDKTPFNQRLNVISQQILSRTRLDKIIKELELIRKEIKLLNFREEQEELFRGLRNRLRTQQHIGIDNNKCKNEKFS